MPLGVLSVVGQGMGVLDRGGDCFGGKCGASHCNQRGLCDVVVRRCVNRSGCRLGWSVVGTGISVLDVCD